MTNGSNQQRRFETKLNLNLFKDIYKKLHIALFVYFFLFFVKQMFKQNKFSYFNILIFNNLYKMLKKSINKK